uniref:PKD_channel domain-containing protein n=1 Tax=Macrostomum lignano TaxID=282301 RepID=A0A1I8F1G8_9PLAT
SAASARRRCSSSSSTRSPSRSYLATEPQFLRRRSRVCNDRGWAKAKKMIERTSLREAEQILGAGAQSGAELRHGLVEADVLEDSSPRRRNTVMAMPWLNCLLPVGQEVEVRVLCLVLQQAGQLLSHGDGRRSTSRTTLRELIIYCIFLIVLMILTFGMTSTTMYYYTQVLSALFLDSTDDPVNKPTFRNPRLDPRLVDSDNNFTDPRETNFIYYENKLLGVPRLRQLRVRNNSCNIASNFKDTIPFCYSTYSRQRPEQGSVWLHELHAWNYTSDDILDGQSLLALSWPATLARGYYIDLGRDRDTTLAIVNELYSGLWWTEPPESHSFHSLQCQNINLFCFPATGGALPSWEFRTVKLLRYVEPMDYFVLVCEGIFMLFICYYIVEEAIEIKRNKLDYFKSFWNWLDILVIVISLDENKYPDFDFLSYWQQQFNHGIAITVFFAWVKIFKYISFNKTMTQLSSTLGACAKDLLGFAVMFFIIIFFAFAQLGYLIFGTQVQETSASHLHSVPHHPWRLRFQLAANCPPSARPLYFLLYVFFVFFVLINMFLAIINDTYSEVKNDLANQPNDFEMTDYFKQGLAASSLVYEP